jgi:hypothetical protein
MSLATPVLLRVFTTTSTPSASSNARRAAGESTRTHRRVSIVLDASVAAPDEAGEAGERVLVESDRGVGDRCLDMVRTSKYA